MVEIMKNGIDEHMQYVTDQVKAAQFKISKHSRIEICSYLHVTDGADLSVKLIIRDNRKNKLTLIVYYDNEEVNDINMVEILKTDFYNCLNNMIEEWNMVV